MNIKTIPGYENYSVTDDGKVFGKSGQLKPQICRNGYHNVFLYKNGGRTGKGIHQLVLLAFVGPPKQGFETRHLDNDKSNNRLDNLQYGTKYENTLDRIGAGSHVCQKLTREQACYVKSSSATGKQLAEELGVSQSLISMIRSGQRWSHAT